MADQRILATENMIGASHPTLADTLNRLTLVSHENDGTHKFVLATTASTSTSTGAIVTAGGAGIAKSLFVGEVISVGGAGSPTAPAIVAGADTNTGIYFPAADNVAITTAGVAKVLVADKGLAVTVNANGGALQLSAGITFPATAVAATDPNTLDDYEEGTWDVVSYGGTSAGTQTASVHAGTYTKIGNFVYLAGALTISGHTGTGQLRIGPLPFTPAENSLIGLVGVSTTDFAKTANTMVQMVAQTAGYIGFYQVGTAATDITFTQVAVETAFNIQFTGTYRV